MRWKHKTRRDYCSGVLDRQPRATGLTPHEGDAVGIGCYVWERLTGRPIVERHGFASPRRVLTPRQ